MGLKTHFYARVAAFVVGFFGGFALFVFVVQDKLQGVFLPTALLFFGVIFGGGYLAQAAFASLSPATCPQCGARSAVPGLLAPMSYACRSCGAETDGGKAMLAEMVASMPTPKEQVKRELGLSWIFFVIGLGMAGVGIWLGGEPIELLRMGVSTDAKVVRVTSQRTLDKDGNSQTSYTAFIEYRVAGKGTPLTLQRSWSVKDGSVSYSGYDNGEQLKVLYHPTEPWRARIKSFGDLFFAPVLIGGVGLVFALFGFFMIRRKQ